MKITVTRNPRHAYIEAELCHPDYGSEYEYQFIEYDYDEQADFDKIIGKYIHKNVSDFWHNVALTTEYVIDGELYIIKDTYGVATGEHIGREIKVYTLK